MSDVDFQVTGIEPGVNGLTPLVQFRLRLTASPETEVIHGVLLQAQIQIQAPQRAYTAGEKERMFELFGPPERWGETLRNRLWAHANVTVGPFTRSTEVLLPVPCSLDLNLAATKYFYALKAGEVPLLFLFSGSLFYASPEGRLQVERISWNKECEYRLSVPIWRELMERHYPGCAWLHLRREVFDQLWAYKRRQRLATWEEAVERLLRADETGANPKSESPEIRKESEARNPDERCASADAPAIENRPIAEVAA